MTTIGSNNLDLNSLRLGSLGSFGLSSGGGELGTFINCIFAGAFTDSEEEKAMATGTAIQTGIGLLAKTAMKILSKLAANETAVAAAEVGKNNRKAKRLEKKQEKAKLELENNLNEINSEIQIHTDKLAVANETIEDATSLVAEQQERINEIIEQIQEKQNELATCNDPAKQKQLLNDIQGLSSLMVSFLSEVADIQAIIEGASSVVEEAVTNIETCKGNSVEIAENGQMEITEIAQEGAEAVQDNVESEAVAAKNTATAASATSAAVAASTNVVTAGTAPKLYKVAADQSAAATKRTVGAGNNLREVFQGIGRLSENTSLLETFNTTIGSALLNFDELVGNWNGTLNPLIESIGSFANVTTNAEAIDQAVKTDLQKIGGSNNSKDPLLTAKSTNDIFTALLNKEENKDKEEKKPVTPTAVKGADLATPKVEIKINFGI